MTDAPEPTDDTKAAVRWPFGRLTLIFVAIVAVGVLVSQLGGDDSADPPTASTVDGFDVASFPPGALAGELAPDVSFPLFDGSTFSMAAHVADDGRPLVLNFWASWCFPCRTEMPEFSEVAAANPDVHFVGVAIDDSFGPAQQFAEEIQVVYPLGIDEEGTVAGAFPWIGLPTTYLIGADGRVTHQIQGQITGAALQAFIDFDFGTGS